MSKSWILVPRPIVSSNKPVAIGSRVPQCPIFLISSLRRTKATTSCDVIPSALSTNKTPSGVAIDDFTNCLQDFLFDFGQRSAHARARGQRVPASTELHADR